MRDFGNIFGLFMGALIAGSAAASANAKAPSWAPLIGTWRAADFGSCGIDDVRHGRITAVSKDALLTDKIHCSIESGARTARGYSMKAICEVGANYYAALSYEWRLTSPTEAVLTQDGYEKRLIRCEGGVE